MGGYKYFDPGKLVIIRDTREQIKRFDSPEWVSKYKVVEKTLDRGDYSFEYNGINYSSIFVIEYKRVCELLTNISDKDRDKFKEKIYQGSYGTDFYRIVIEGSLGQFLDPIYCRSSMDRFLAFNTIYKWESENRRLKFEFIPDNPVGTAQYLAELVIFQYIQGFIKYYCR